MIRIVAMSIMLLFTSGAIFPEMACTEEKTAVYFKGELFRSLFSPEPFLFTKLDQTAFATLPDTLKSRITEYMDRREVYRLRYRIATLPRDEQESLVIKHQNQARGVYSLVSTPGVEQEAAEYARKANIAYEWEGESSGPLREAAFANNYLDTPSLRPYLILFLLHRYRCAYECLVYEKDTRRAQEIAEKYHRILRLAREYPDPLVGLMARDFDGLPGNIYIGSRDFKGVRP